ncbi:DUF998 domain-containing protein [Corynebacterium pseudotuberculosis]|uniref:DUF998 domain-containing protein n=1 Tax=Corynebacterium pseudotuberculosis TaxID=1719 RepID=UPI000B428D78|nr:DUF998 domain-containing protein [Corynebacterium pseudotuberculosis]
MRMLYLGKILVILGGLAYASFITEAIYGYPLNPKYAYLSEYAAADSSLRWIFAGSDVLSAVFVIAGALCFIFDSALRTRWTWHQKVVVAGLLVSSAATILDVMYPLPCAESLPSCPVQSHLNAHVFASSVAVAGHMMIAIAAIIFVWKKLSSPRKWAIIPVFAGVGFIVSTASLLFAMAIQAPTGYEQRGQAIFACILIVTSSIILLKHVDRSTRVGMPNR